MKSTMPFSYDDFPIFRWYRGQGNPLIFLDNASTSQKPDVVIEAVADFYRYHNANVHRGIYKLAEQATHLYEQARSNVAQFIRSPNSSSIVFTGGTTETINVVATAWGMRNVKQGDQIVVTELEHHANLIPWQRLAYCTGATIRYIPTTIHGQLDLDSLDTIITSSTKVVALATINHFLGTHHDVARIVKRARSVGARVVLDAAQSCGHEQIDVGALDPDFLAFSGHKMFGPMGIGVLYVKPELYDVVSTLDPYQVGGGMVLESTLDGRVSSVPGYARWKPMPHLLEAGTPPVADVVGLAAAVDYLAQVDWRDIHNHERSLVALLVDGLSDIPGITLLGPVDELKKQGHMVAFVYDGMHAHDLAAHLDVYGICVRAGHHCAQAAHKKLGIEHSVRVSVAGYTRHEDIDFFVRTLKKIVARS